MLSTILISIFILPIFITWFVCIFAPILFFPFAGAVGVGFVFLNSYFNRKKAVLMSDPQVELTTVFDDKSPIVDFGRTFPGLALGEVKIQGRIKVGKMLLQAQETLPYGLKFKIIECYRSHEIEEKYQNDHFSKFKSKNPACSMLEIEGERARLTRRYEQSGLHTGGAFNVAMIDAAGFEVDLGEMAVKRVNSLGLVRENNMSSIVKKNRKILFKALSKVGFINSSVEWWHWSYGDRYWSVLSHSKFAIYGPLAA